MRRADAHAHDVLYRSNTNRCPGRRAFKRLSAEDAGDPCSNTTVSLMRPIDLSSSYIQAVGHVRSGVIECSSLGRSLAGIDL